MQHISEQNKYGSTLAWVGPFPPGTPWNTIAISLGGAAPRCQIEAAAAGSGASKAAPDPAELNSDLNTLPVDQAVEILDWLLFESQFHEEALETAEEPATPIAPATATRTAQLQESSQNRYKPNKTAGLPLAVSCQYPFCRYSA